MTDEVAAIGLTLTLEELRRWQAEAESRGLELTEFCRGSINAQCVDRSSGEPNAVNVLMRMFDRAGVSGPEIHTLQDAYDLLGPDDQATMMRLLKLAGANLEMDRFEALNKLANVPASAATNHAATLH